MSGENRLSVAGIFKARLFSWQVRTAESGAVGVNIGFVVTDQLDGQEWKSLEAYEDQVVYGTFYVVKKDGSVNTSAVEQLAKSIRWNGDLRSIQGDPPEGKVQITVKDEPYNGKSVIKATWMNPEDYTPDFGGDSEQDVAKLQNRFGSLLRAAAAGAAKAAPAAKPKAPLGVGGSVGNAPTTDGKQPPDDEIPF